MLIRAREFIGDNFTEDLKKIYKNCLEAALGSFRSGQMVSAHGVALHGLRKQVGYCVGHPTAKKKAGWD